MLVAVAAGSRAVAVVSAHAVRPLATLSLTHLIRKLTPEPREANINFGSKGLSLVPAFATQSLPSILSSLEDVARDALPRVETNMAHLGSAVLFSLPVPGLVLSEVQKKLDIPISRVPFSERQGESKR